MPGPMAPLPFEPSDQEVDAELQGFHPSNADPKFLRWLTYQDPQAGKILSNWERIPPQERKQFLEVLKKKQQQYKLYNMM